MKVLKTRRVLVVFMLCVVVAVTASANRLTSNSASGPVTGAQDTANLERRIGLLEQRFYSIETSLNRLDQQVSLSQRTTTNSSARDLEINLLRSEIAMLQRRLAEIECGLVRLDERTTTPAQREARKRAGGSDTDPCRLSADAPVRLSTRP